MRRRSTRMRGFTLVELMVAMSLAGVLVAGAFQIHAVFNSQGQRQQQIADVQQSLRVSMQIIERTLRNAGAGTTNGRMTGPGCAGAFTFYRAQYYNSNVWPPPQVPGAYDVTAADNDPDPDILRVVSAVEAGDVLATAANTLRGPANFQSNYLNGDFLLFVNTQSATATTANGCLRQLLADATPVVGVVPTATINHNPGGWNCINNDAACMGTVTFPTQVRRFRNQTFFRVAPPNKAADQSRLVMATVPLSDNLANMNWSVISDDIEDMQIALMMADGRVCNDRDDPAIAGCDPSQASAIRITLVARTMSRVPGNPKTVRGGFEDSATDATNPDGFLRRSLTTEISLRN